MVLKKRSCIDHLVSLTNIIETQKHMALEEMFKLGKLGFTPDSKYLLAVKSLYNNVMCSVRLKGFLSEWFDVNVGLKQGCLISPGLFNLYINDLAFKIKELNKGITLNNENVSLLMYADDIVLISENERDLQLMLDTLEEWCQTWDVVINEQKSKIMHFRNKCTPVTKVKFTCGDKQIDKCAQYKYLGLMLNEYLDYNKIADYVAQSAHRALGLLIAKDSSQGGFSYDVFTKLYDSLVSSIIENGTAVWGHRSY